MGGKLCSPKEPTISFDDRESKWQEINDFIRKATGRSTAEINLVVKSVQKPRRGAILAKGI